MPEAKQYDLMILLTPGNFNLLDTLETEAVKVESLAVSVGESDGQSVNGYGISSGKGYPTYAYLAMNIFIIDPAKELTLASKSVRAIKPLGMFPDGIPSNQVTSLLQHRSAEFDAVFREIQQLVVKQVVTAINSLAQQGS